MDKIIEEISKIGIVPVIALEDARDAEPLAEALCKGGLPCAEVTFRTEAAEDSIRAIAQEFPEMLVGAGTVLATQQVDRAIAAGAKFIVSPGLNAAVVSYCLEKGVPVIPGTSNPSDVEAALGLGLEVVKFFPAEQAGGIRMIRAMSAPYTKVRFMPTGGINAGNLNTYLEFEKVVACGGSWMVKKDLVEGRKFDEIQALTKEAVDRMLGLEVMHVGVYAADAKEAGRIAGSFGGAGLEVMEGPCPGEKGRITVGTNDMGRAMYHLGKKGVEFDGSTAEKDARGKVKAINVRGEMGGFAVRLMQKG